MERKRIEFEIRWFNATKWNGLNWIWLGFDATNLVYKSWNNCKSDKRSNELGEWNNRSSLNFSWKNNSSIITTTTIWTNSKSLHSTPNCADRWGEREIHCGQFLFNHYSACNFSLWFGIVKKITSYTACVFAFVCVFIMLKMHLFHQFVNYIQSC